MDYITFITGWHIEDTERKYTLPRLTLLAENFKKFEGRSLYRLMGALDYHSLKTRQYGKASHASQANAESGRIRKTVEKLAGFGQDRNLSNFLTNALQLGLSPEEIGRIFNNI